VTVGLLAVLALPSAGLLPAGPMPTTPASYLFAAVCVSAFLVFFVLPWLGSRRRGEGALEVVLAALATVPFLAYGLHEAPALAGAQTLPGSGWFLLIAAALVLRSLGRKTARATAVVVLGLVAGDALLAGAGLPLLPREVNPLRSAVQTLGATWPEISRPDRLLPAQDGLRALAPVPVREQPQTLWRGDGPWYEPAGDGPLPRPGPVVFVPNARS
jgi:hypothetical protein